MVHIRTHYLDASAIYKLVIDEDGSSALRSYLKSHGVLVTTPLCFAETLGVLKTKFVKKHITEEQYLAACEELTAYVRDETLKVEDIGLTTRQVFDKVELLCKKHKLDLSDACQLVTLREGWSSQFTGDSRPILLTADRDLAKAAREEGLRVWDIMHEPSPPPV